MRILLLIVTFFLTISSLQSQTLKKALFLGNSYTYYNSLPSMLSQLASSMGDSLYTDQNTLGGARFMNHASNSATYSKIKTRAWDFVVLQGQSQEPSWPLSQLESEVFPYAKKICDSIKANHACTEILFFETWGRQNGDNYNCSGWPPVCTFEGMNNRLLVSYYTMAVQNHAAMTPVGMAWKLVREDGQFNNINLYVGDGSHPSVYGSYLTACVMYNSMFFRPVNSDFYSGISEDEALYLQSKANEVFSREFEYFLSDTITNADYTFNKQAWFDDGVSVIADFAYEQNNQEVAFTNYSINANNYQWDFGDASATATDHSPVHEYGVASAYDVRLIAYGDCANDTLTQTLDLSTNINALYASGLKWQQSKGNLSISNLKDVKQIDIYDVRGVLLSSLDCQWHDNVTFVNKHKTPMVVVAVRYNNDTIERKKILLK